MVRRSLLGVFAHPDDESFGPGGTLARYAAEGGEVHVVIATDGIAGSVETTHTMSDHETLAQVRSTELANAAVALGVASIWSLPYRDSGMRDTTDNEHPDALVQQPMEALVSEILGYIHRLKPLVIVTHDPFGGYGHPDHIRCCEAATAAFHLAVNQYNRDAVGANGSGSENGEEPYRGPKKLYYTAFDKRILKVIVKMMPLLGHDPAAVGRNKDINLVEISGWDTPVNARINIAPYYTYKMAASRAHASQFSGGPSYLRLLPNFIRRRFTDYESFTRAVPEPTECVEDDLFTGVA